MTRLIYGNKAFSVFRLFVYLFGPKRCRGIRVALRGLLFWRRGRGIFVINVCKISLVPLAFISRMVATELKYRWDESGRDFVECVVVLVEPILVLEWGEMVVIMVLLVFNLCVMLVQEMASLGHYWTRFGMKCGNQN